MGIKDSSGDIPHMMRMIAAVRPHRPDFSFLTGWDAALAPMLFIGCNGGTNATSGVVPELTRARSTKPVHAVSGIARCNCNIGYCRCLTP